MLNIADINEKLKLKLKKDYLISDLIIRSSDGTMVLYVSIENLSENAAPGFVSKKQLDNLSKKLSEKYSVPVEYVLTPSAKLEKLAQAVETLLISKFEKIIEEFSLSFVSSDKVNAWIKTVSSDFECKENVESHLQSVLIDHGIQSISYQWISEASVLPTAINILISIKRYQPLDLNVLTSKLIVDYADINTKWLNRQLDKLIKKKFILRDNSTGSYSLTGLGLGVIPSIHGKSSSDITRALALGRRKW